MSGQPERPADDNGPPDALRAIDWAPGVLGDADRRRVELRRETDPAFRALSDQWADRLALRTDGLPPVEPPPELRDRIAATIDRPAAQPVVPAPRVAPGSRTGFWDHLPLWRGAAAAFAALALVLLIARPPAPPVGAPAPPAGEAALLATTLAPEGGPPLISVAIDPDRRSLIVAPAGGPDSEGRVPELWLMPADGTPRSLGVIELGGVRRPAVPATILELVADGATLAVSLEPAGGSPTGQPTGPVVATGTLARI